jgi:hypothetical protein
MKSQPCEYSQLYGNIIIFGAILIPQVVQACIPHWRMLFAVTIYIIGQRNFPGFARRTPKR